MTSRFFFDMVPLILVTGLAALVLLIKCRHILPLSVTKGTGSLSPAIPEKGRLRDRFQGQTEGETAQEDP